jgi:hypothetical protein
MLPSSSVRHSKRDRTGNNITKDLWNNRRTVVAADHCLPNARADLELLWKEQLVSKGCVSEAAVVSARAVTEKWYIMKITSEHVLDLPAVGPGRPIVGPGRPAVGSARRRLARTHTSGPGPAA